MKKSVAFKRLVGLHLEADDGLAELLRRRRARGGRCRDVAVAGGEHDLARRVGDEPAAGLPDAGAGVACLAGLVVHSVEI